MLHERSKRNIMLIIIDLSLLSGIGTTVLEGLCQSVRKLLQNPVPYHNLLVL
jgi:hypothetical protein